MGFESAGLTTLEILPVTAASFVALMTGFNRYSTSLFIA
jgi:hypothetical protein